MPSYKLIRWLLTGLALSSPLLAATTLRAQDAGHATSDAFAILVTTRATMRERAGPGSRRDTPTFPGKRGRFTRPNDEGRGRLSLDSGLNAVIRPVSTRLD